MLINFSFGNFCSFRDIKSLRMEAGRVEDLTESVIEKDGFRLLPVAAIYGANSSGKSNLFKAMGTFRFIVLETRSLTLAIFSFKTLFCLMCRHKKPPRYLKFKYCLRA